MKKTSLITLLLLFVLSTTYGQSESDTHTLTMTITALDPIEGKVGIQLMDTDEKVVKQQWVAVEEATMQVVFIDVPSGRYAVQYYHDANDNDELDFAWYGAPSEGYGNSNNVKGFFGPPDFEEQLFDISEDMSIEMKTEN